MQQTPDLPASDPRSGESEPSVATPLLREHNNQHSSSTEPQIHHLHRNHPKFLRVLLIVTASLFFVSIGDYMQRAPWMRVQEDIVCRSYYKKSLPTEFGSPYEPIPEAKCKVLDVQAKLAVLRGWDQMFGNIPSIVTAVPYGIMADKYGRKPVMILCLMGLFLSLAWVELVGYYSNFFAIEWYWAQNLFMFIGGGSPVARSMYFTIVADIASEERRSSAFFQLSSSGLVATLIAIPVSWQLLKKSMFVPLSVSLGFFAIGIMVLFFMPETLDRTKISDPADMSGSGEESGDEAGLVNAHKKRTIISVLVRKMEDSRLILSSPLLFSLALTFLVMSLHALSISILFQFASERFHWSIADSSFLIPFSSVAQFVVLLAMLPAIYALLARFGLSVALKDLVVTRGSLIFNILGALLIAVSPTPSFLIVSVVVYSFGYGFSAAVRSLLTSLVRPDQVSRMYAILAIFDTIGCLISGPVLSGAYSWGLHRGGLWSGSVFGIVAVLFAVVCLPTFLFRLPVVEVEED